MLDNDYIRLQELSAFWCGIYGNRLKNGIGWDLGGIGWRLSGMGWRWVVWVGDGWHD